MLPKSHIEDIKLRNVAIGRERRRNLAKLVLEKEVVFPKTVEFKDIDNAVKEWVEKSLDISYDGVRLPTFRLFSSQRLNEYAQTWKHLDDTRKSIDEFQNYK